MLGAFPSKAHFFTKIRNIFLITFISSSFNFSNPVLRFPKYSRVALEIGGFGRPADVNIFQAEFLVNSFRNITLSKIFEMWNSFFALSKNFLGMQRYCARHVHIAFITKRKLQLSFFVHCKKSAPKEYHGLHLAKYYCTRIRS